MAAPMAEKLIRSLGGGRRKATVSASAEASDQASHLVATGENAPALTQDSCAASDPQFQKLVAVGDAARDAKKWAEAAIQYKAALALQPSAAGIWVQLGNMNKEAGASDAALASYQAAIKLAQELPGASPRRRVVLFSPVPPMKTGTANYFALILAELAATSIDRSQVRIAVDESYLPGPVAGLEIMGFPVVSYRQVPNVVLGNETRVYFLANNEFHAYCFASLSSSSRQEGGRIASVVHEPSCFMLMNYLSANRYHGFDDGQMIRAMHHQFGNKAEFILNARRSGDLPFDAEYLMSVQGETLARSDEIWTNSQFARRKLELESGTEASVTIRSSNHPVVPPAPPTELGAVEPKPEDVVRIGMFGWVAPSKRINPAILAFAWALQTRPAAERRRYELMVVGQLPPQQHYDPAGLVSARDIARQVKFTGFVGPERFDQLVETCDLILNLRFPSCGETSGTLERALSNGIPVVTTGYQAFAEMPASAQASPFWPREAAQLFGLFCRVMSGDLPRPVNAPRHADTSIAQLIYMNICAE